MIYQLVEKENIEKKSIFIYTCLNYKLKVFLEEGLTAKRKCIAPTKIKAKIETA